MPRRAGRKYQLKRLAREYETDVSNYRFSPYIGVRSVPLIIRDTAHLAKVRIVTGPPPSQPRATREEARVPVPTKRAAAVNNRGYNLTPITILPADHDVSKIPEQDPRKQLYARVNAQRQQ